MDNELIPVKDEKRFMVACQNCEELFKDGARFCPHCGQKTNDDLTLVCNGIIENYRKIQNRFVEIPKNIQSDTEISFYFLTYLVNKYKNSDEAIRVFKSVIKGNYAFVIFIKKLINLLRGK